MTDAQPFPWDEDSTLTLEVTTLARAVPKAPTRFAIIFEARPVPQGRPRAFSRGGQTIVTKDGTSRRFELALAAAARARALAIGWRPPPSDVDLALNVTVYRAANQGDLTNFVKAIEDALTEGGVWLDDRRVTLVIASMTVDRLCPRVDIAVEARP